MSLRGPVHTQNPVYTQIHCTLQIHCILKIQCTLKIHYTLKIHCTLKVHSTLKIHCCSKSIEHSRIHCTLKIHCVLQIHCTLKIRWMLKASFRPFFTLYFQVTQQCPPSWASDESASRLEVRGSVGRTWRCPPQGKARVLGVLRSLLTGIVPSMWHG